MTINELRAALAAKGISVPKNAKKAELELALAQQVDCDNTEVNCDTPAEEDESLLEFLFAEEAKETVTTDCDTTATLTAEWAQLEEAVVLGTSFTLSYIRSFCDSANVTNTTTLLRALEGYASRNTVAAIIGGASFQRFTSNTEATATSTEVSSNEVTLDKLMAAILELRSEVQKLIQKN